MPLGASAYLNLVSSNSFFCGFFGAIFCELFCDTWL